MTKRLASILLASAVVGGGIFVGAAPAEAAAVCTTHTDVGTWHYQHNLQSYLSAAVPSTSSSSINCQLNNGNNSGAVKTLQTELNKCYGRSLTVDGAFGDATQSALRYAQGKAGVSTDGIYGPITREALNWYGIDPSTGPFCAQLQD